MPGSKSARREARKAKKALKGNRPLATSQSTKAVGASVGGSPKVEVGSAIRGEASDGRKPTFSFEHIDVTGTDEFGWNLTDECRKRILDFLRDISANTWSEIKAQQASGHKKHHAMPMSALCEDARARVTVLQLDEWDEFFRFRLSGKERLWGFRVNDVFHVVWWDPNHLVYPTEP